MQRRLNRIWYDGAAGAAALAPLAWLYGTAVAVRRRAYQAGWLRAARAGQPVIIIGNLSVGGTGKTPLVAWLAGQLQLQGLAVGIASRGYGASARTPRRVLSGGDWQRYGDEPLLLQRRAGCPVVVARDRVAAALELGRAGARVILCDDGLQHLRLARDCEIVVIDAVRGLGNGRLLPAGPLRESPARLAHADAIVVNGEPGPQLLQQIARLGGPAPLVMRLVPAAVEPLATARGAGAPGIFHGQPLEELRGQRLHAVAGIGHPQRFFSLLQSRGLQIVPHAFADHHPFAAQELDFPDGLPILMTEKDAVRCGAFASARMGCVPVSAALAAADARRLLECVSKCCEGAKV